MTNIELFNVSYLTSISATKPIKFIYDFAYPHLTCKELLKTYSNTLVYNWGDLI